MAETITLKLGEERPVHLPPAPAGGSWSHEVSGMSSAIDVKKMWTSDPYPEDDEEGPPGRPRAMVFLIRGRSSGRATVRFWCPGHDEATVEVDVGS